MGGPDVFVNKGDVEKAWPRPRWSSRPPRSTTTPTRAPWTTGAASSGGKEDQLTVWSNSYEADQTRMHISQMLDLPLHKVRVISSYVGGQFGRDDTGDQPFFLFTALLAKKTGPAVKFKHTPARELSRHAPAGDLPRQDRRQEGRDHHRHLLQVDRQRRRLRRPHDVRAEVRAEGADRGGVRAHPEHPLRIVRRVHQQAARPA